MNRTMQSYFTYGVVDLSWADERTGIYDVRNAKHRTMQSYFTYGVVDLWIVASLSWQDEIIDTGSVINAKRTFIIKFKLEANLAW